MINILSSLYIHVYTQNIYIYIYIYTYIYIYIYIYIYMVYTVNTQSKVPDPLNGAVIYMRDINENQLP